VEGKTITSPALNVLPHQPVMVNGKPLPEAETTRLWLYHKPAGQITSHSDPQGRPTVFEAVEGRIAGRVQSVGRLDFHSEGLLLLTNDGELKRFIELPATGWIRRYRVRVFGTPEAGVLAKMAAGVTIDGIRYGPMEVTLDKEASNSWLTVSLKEGKNREIRRVFEHFGFNVNRLIRTAYGPFQLAELPRGDLKEVPRKMLRASVGQKVTLRD
jgi:23S rRNA pseudouridine2605 synthase